LWSTFLSKQVNRLLGIDALRGIAALAVVLYHSRAIDWVGGKAFFELHHGWSWNPQIWLVWLTSPLRSGFLGVQLLFVLSGYCIHRNQARGLAAGDDVRLDLPRYAFRRFFRIYPTYIAALVVNGLVLFALIPWLGARGYPVGEVEGHHSWYVFFMNLLTMQNILPGVPPYEGVFWSLSIEIHLYIAYLAVLWVTRRYGAGRMLMVSLAATLLYAETCTLFRDSPVARQVLAFGDFMPYWFTWCVGAYVAEIQTGRARPMGRAWMWWVVLPVCGFAGAGIALANQMNMGKLAWLPMAVMGEVMVASGVGGLMYVALRPRADKVWGSWSGRGLAFVGMFSYSLYAIHVPILSVFAALWGGKSESMLPPMLAVVCALAVSYVFFNIVERWTLQPPKGFFLTKKAPPVRAPHEEAASAEVPVGQG
jgi:peptidoglycan/LPS O-acetylase OafA/YrhL